MTRRYRLAWGVSVCQMLRTARIDAGLDVIEIAVAVGREENTVRRIERGDTEPSARVIDLWLRACGARAYVTVERRAA